MSTPADDRTPVTPFGAEYAPAQEGDRARPDRFPVDPPGPDDAGGLRIAPFVDEATPAPTHDASRQPLQ